MARQELLDDVVAHIRAHGIVDTTLRQIAEAIGTSHRMLLYHFGSRAGLLAAAVDAIESDERAAHVRTIAAATSVEDALRRVWRRLRAPQRAGEERLFFELAALAAQGTAGTEGFNERFVGPWLDLEPRPGTAAARRLDVAVLRGLLLDLLVTGDRRGVDAAFEQFAALRTASGADVRAES
jgi:AcrR family transcriptional regulator